MGLRETIQGWLRRDGEKSDDLREAEANEIDREFGNQQADAYTDLRLRGGDANEFEHDQQAPGR